MKKLLLSLALLLPFLATAEIASWSVVFKNAENNNSQTAFTNSTKIGDLCESGANNLKSISSTKLTYTGQYGIRIGQNKNPGNITFDIAEAAVVTPSKIILKVSANKNADKLKFQFNDKQYELTSANLNASYAEFTITDCTEPLTSVKFERATSTGQGFIYLKEIAVYYETTPVGPQAPVLAFEPATVELKENDSVLLSDVTTLSGVPEGAEVTYKSSDENIACVMGGELMVVGVGEATITATTSATADYLEGTAELKVVVKSNKLDPQLSFSETSVEKFLNSTEYGEFPVLNNPNNLDVTYTSSKPEVATVEDGVVTILADGTTTITATSAATDAYNAGEASYTLTVTDASISSKYVLVKDIAQIENGSKVLIVNTEAGKTLSNVPKENNFAAVDVKIEGEEVGSLSEEVAILEIEAVDNKYAFKVTNYSDGEKVNVYLASTTTATKNYLKHIKEQTLASVSISETNNAVITFSLNPNDRNTIQFNPNNGSPLFSCYTGGQEPVQLYVQSGVAAPVIDHIINYRFVDGRFEINFKVDNEEVAIYYNIQKADAPARVIAADGKDYIRHDGNTFIVDDGDTVSYYAEHKGVKSEIKTVLANTTTTGIEAIEAEGEGAARYFNLQGVEVAQPAAGQVYIKVVNGVATKVVK